MSHELRTPLNAVIGFSEVLLERMFGDLNERQEEYLRDIPARASTCSSCSTRSSTCPRSRPAGWSSSTRRSRCATLLEYAASMVRERAAAHGITLRLEVGADVGDVEADELRFKQVVLNLLSNAVKFTPRRRARSSMPRDRSAPSS